MLYLFSTRFISFFGKLKRPSAENTKNGKNYFPSAYFKILTDLTA